MFGYRPRRLPKQPEDVLNGMWLTNRFHQKPTWLPWNSVEQRYFDLTKPVVVMTHGWNDEWHSQHWLTEAQKLFLAYEDVNFVGVEWAKAGQNIDYFQSAADTQTVGRMIAKVRGYANTDLAVSRVFFTAARFFLRKTRDALPFKKVTKADLDALTTRYASILLSLHWTLLGRTRVL